MCGDCLFLFLSTMSLPWQTIAPKRILGALASNAPKRMSQPTLHRSVAPLPGIVKSTDFVNPGTQRLHRKKKKVWMLPRHPRLPTTMILWPEPSSSLSPQTPLYDQLFPVKYKKKSPWMGIKLPPMWHTPCARPRMIQQIPPL